MNKITNTRVGDAIHFFVNGVEDSGLVVKMNNAYVTVFKSGKYKDIKLDETFFVKDIILNKTWDSMDEGERLDALSKAHAPSPRYLTKTWDQIPKDLQTLLTKNNSSNISATEGEDDDENVTQRIFDKALSGNANFKTQPKRTGDQASSSSLSTGADTSGESGGFKLNQPIGSEGADTHGGHGATARTRQQGIREREPSVEEEKGVKRGGKHDSKENKEALGSSEVKLFSGYNSDTGEKEYNDKAWVSWLSDRKDDVMKEDKEKSWKEMLEEIKSNVENSVHGNAGRNPNSGVSTQTSIDAPEDYEGASHSGIRPEQFKHENKKPSIKKQQLDLGDTKPSDTHGGGNKYDTPTESKTIKGRAVDQEKDKKI
jgi:hypothetical protein